MSCRSRSAGRATVRKTLAQKTGSPWCELILGPEYHCGPVMVFSGLQSPRCIVVRVYGLVGNRSAETNSRTIFLRRAGSGTQLATADATAEPLPSSPILRGARFRRQSRFNLHSSRQQYFGMQLQGAKGNSVFHFPPVSIPIHLDFVQHRLLAPSLLGLVHAESKDTTVGLVASMTRQNCLGWCMRLYERPLSGQSP